MKRAQRKADLILTADLHLTDSSPISRTDDYMLAQTSKLRFLQALSDDNDHCPILCAGDIFHNWKASPWLSAWALTFLPKPMIVIPGNHDLPMHSLEYYDKSGLSLLEKVSKSSNNPFLSVLGARNDLTTYISENGEAVEIIGVPFGQLKNMEIEQSTDKEKTRILMLHELVWPEARPVWGKADDWSAPELTKKYGKYFDLILTGDNHQTFVYNDSKNNCLLVNPGSMMRMTADQADFEPCCYLYYASNNEIKQINFPIKKEVHNRDYIDQKNDRDERIAAYIERMNHDWKISLSFPNNLQAFFAENDTPTKVREIIWQHLEAEKM